MPPVDLNIRLARHDDLPAIVRLLVDDTLGSQRERYEIPLPQPYETAFAAIEVDPNNQLMVAEAGGEVIGVMQLTFIPSLTYQGSMRLQIEGVRVDERYRSQGFGQVMFTWAIELARQRGCRLVQLTTDRQRLDAVRFYERLGFKPSHLGMKLDLLLSNMPSSEQSE